MSKSFIVNLGKIATFNGGLTNSAINRLKILSEIKEYRNDSFYIFYCSEVESTPNIEHFFIKKHNLNNKINFINANDYYLSAKHGVISPIVSKELKNRYQGYTVNGVDLDYSQYLTYCLDSLISELDSKLIYLFMDVPLTPDYRLLLTDSRLRRIFFTHSEHLKTPELGNGHWKKNFYKGRAYFQPIEDPNTFTVSFSKIQHEWIVSREGRKKNYHCIPHYYCATKDSNIYREKKIVWVGRITNDIKKIKLAIDSYVKSGVKVPFEIYGNGPELQSMKKYVTDLNMSNMIKFMGQVDNVDNVFQSSYLSLCISDYEGFGLSILESLANGCPVIASDVNYRPRELIQNGSNGYLTKNTLNDIASSINNYFTKDNFNSFSQNAIRTSNSYSLSQYKKSWVDLISLASIKLNVTPLSSLNCKVRISNKKLLITRLVESDSKDKIFLRIYNLDLTTYHDIILKNEINYLSLNTCKKSLLSIIQLNDHNFKEHPLELSHPDSNLLTYKTIKLPSTYNLALNFNFVVVRP